jgi:glycosyltransferase involved in cell wall biosynthesis
MKVSVAVCTYNGEQYLEEQLLSILNQSVPPDEIIICDDRSTDNTVGIIEQLKERHPQLAVVVNEKNLGVKNNFEKAIGLTTGDIIFLSDQDDIWEKNKVQKFLMAFKQNPSVKAFFSDGYILSDGEAHKSLWESLGFNEANILKNKFSLFLYLNYFDNIVTGAALAFRTEAKKDIFPFRLPGNVIHDAWIGLKLSNTGNILPLSEKTFFYRVHSNQQISLGNSEYLDYLRRAKQQLIGGAEALTIKEEFGLLWNTYLRYQKLRKVFSESSEGMRLLFADLNKRRIEFFRRNSFQKKYFYRFKWLLKRATLKYSL